MSFLINPFAFLAAGGDFESIATVTVGSGGASSIEFTSIPGTYQHLQVRGVWTSSSAAELQVAFNSDTTNGNYYRHQIYGSGAAAVAGANQLRTFATYTETNANVFSGLVMDILDYASTSKNKTAKTMGGFDSNGGGYIQIQSGLWMNAAAITSIAVTPSAGTISQHSTLALYGIKA